MKTIKYEKDLHKLEIEFIDLIQRFREQNPESRPLIEYMIACADEAIESGSLLFHGPMMKLLVNISERADSLVMVNSRLNPVYCPKCDERIIHDCGKLKCFNCSSVYYIENEITKEQCQTCIKYRDRTDINFEKSVYHGFKVGCPGVYGKGNELEKAKIKEVKP